MRQLSERKRIKLVSKSSASYRLLLVGVLGAQFITVFEYGLKNVALPVIQNDFRIQVDLLSWVLASSVLTRVALMPVYGRLGDVLGKKRLYLIGIFIFFCGSSLLAVAPTFNVLILACVLQGLGSACEPLGQAIIADIFPQESRGKALGILFLIAPLGMMVGSVAGGLLIEWMDWQVIFLGVSFGSLLCLYGAYRFLPPIEADTDGGAFDWIGAVSLAVAVASVLLATTSISLIPLGSPFNLLFWGLALTSLIVLITRSLRISTPFLQPDILSNRSFIIPSIAICFRMAAIEGTRFLMVLYLANSFGLTPRYISFFLVGLSLSMMFGSAYGGYLADRYSSRFLGISGLCMQATGLICIQMVSPPTNILTFLPGMFLSHLGGGIVLIALTKQAQDALGPMRFGMASGLFNTIRFSGAAASTPFLGMLLVYLFEAQGGTQSIPAPYKIGFLILAGVVLLGAAIAALIPRSIEVESKTKVKDTP